MSRKIALDLLADDLARIAGECGALGRDDEARRLLRSGEKLRTLAKSDALPIEIDPKWIFNMRSLPTRLAVGTKTQ
jgi:hypothetical protein